MTLDPSSFYSVSELCAQGFSDGELSEMSQTLVEKGATLDQGFLGAVAMHYKHTRHESTLNGGYVNAYIFSQATGIPYTKVIAKERKGKKVVVPHETEFGEDYFLPLKEINSFIKYRRRRKNTSEPIVDFEIKFISKHSIPDELEQIIEKDAENISLIEGDDSFIQDLEYLTAELPVYQEHPAVQDRRREVRKVSQTEVNENYALDRLAKHEIIDNVALAHEMYDNQIHLWNGLLKIPLTSRIVPEIVRGRKLRAYKVIKTKDSDEDVLIQFESIFNASRLNTHDDEFAEQCTRLVSDQTAYEVATTIVASYDAILKTESKAKRDPAKATILYEGRKCKVIDVRNDILTLRDRVKENRDAMIVTNGRLVFSIARKFLNRGVPFPDLVDEGELALMRALDTYDVHTGNQYTTFATWWIRQRMTRCIQNNRRTIRTPIHIQNLQRDIFYASRELEQLGKEASVENIVAMLSANEEKAPTAKAVEFALKAGHNIVSIDKPFSTGEDATLGDLLTKDDGSSVTENMHRNEVSHYLQEVFTGLNKQERQVLELRYGLPSTPLSPSAITTIIKISKKEIRDLEKRVKPVLDGLKHHPNHVHGIPGISPLEAEAIKLRYGLGVGPMSLEHTATLLGSTRPNIRQIEIRAFRKLPVIAARKGLSVPGFIQN
jgi:RNA polymerase sigma factor (sigma-70 family)